jgi:hypothetical protein
MKKMLVVMLAIFFVFALACSKMPLGQEVKKPEAAFEALGKKLPGLKAEFAPNNPSDRIVLLGSNGSAELTLAADLSASGDSFPVKEISISLAGQTDWRSIEQIIMTCQTEGNMTEERSIYLTGPGPINFPGLKLLIPENGKKTLGLRVKFSSGARSGYQIKLALNPVKATGQTTGKTVWTKQLTGSLMVMRQAKLYVTNAPLPNPVLVNGSAICIGIIQIYASGGDGYFRELNWCCQSSPEVKVTDLRVYERSNQYNCLNGGVSLVGGNMAHLALNNEQCVPEGTLKTYMLIADVIGATANSLLQTFLLPSTVKTPGLTLPYSKLVNREKGGILWSDGSAVPHTENSADYCDCHFVGGLPTDWQTLSR